MNKFNSTKHILTLICILSALNSFSQITHVRMDNIEYLNTSYSNCQTINLNSNTNNNITFKANVRVPHDTGSGGFVYTTGVLTIAYFTGSAEIIYNTYNINPSHWTFTSSQANLDFPTLSFSLNSNNFDDTEGGQIYIIYEDTTNNFFLDSCGNDITFPKFELNPNNTSVLCGSSTSKIFTVDNENNSPGNLSYNWQVGNGWQDTNGNAVSNFTTTSNSVTLVPFAYPPSNVSVTPVLDGVNYPVITSNVSLAPYNPTNTITGSARACSTETYSISNLPNNVSVSSWVVSDTSIATVTNSSGNQTNLNIIGYGLITLTATLTNSCNQSASIPPLEIYVGRPATPTKISGPKTVGYGVLVNYSIAAIPGALEYEWRLPYPYQTVINFSYFGNSWQMLSSTSTTNSINAFSGYGGTSGYVQVSAKNNCGNGGTKYIFVTHSNIGGGQYPRIAPPNDEDDIDNNTEITDNFSVFPNPAKDEIHINIEKFNKNTSYKIQLFDIKNVLIKEISVKNMKKKFSVKNLPSGIYILKIFANKKVSTKKIIISH